MKKHAPTYADHRNSSAFNVFAQSPGGNSAKYLRRLLDCQ
jgi:hypothetical protein